MTIKTYFTCVVYSGDTCMCGVLQHARAECGHKHKTETTARRCLDKLRNMSKDGRSCSATWYYGQVVERETVNDTAIIVYPKYNREGDYVSYERISAYDACTCYEHV